MPITKSNKYGDIITGEKIHLHEHIDSRKHYLINTNHFKLWRMGTEAYVYDQGNTKQIDMGSFNKLIEEVSNMDMDEAFEHIKYSYKFDRIKIIKTVY